MQIHFFPHWDLSGNLSGNGVKPFSSLPSLNDGQKAVISCSAGEIGQLNRVYAHPQLWEAAALFAGQIVQKRAELQLGDGIIHWNYQLPRYDSSDDHPQEILGRMIMAMGSILKDTYGRGYEDLLVIGPPVTLGVLEYRLSDPTQPLPHDGAYLELQCEAVKHIGTIFSAEASRVLSLPEFDLFPFFQREELTEMASVQQRDRR